jgi:hypothetical protein
METCSPVLPKDRVGTNFGPESFESAGAAAPATFPMEAMADPIPAAPVILKKSLREHRCFFFDIFTSPSVHGCR